MRYDHHKYALSRNLKKKPASSLNVGFNPYRNFNVCAYVGWDYYCSARNIAFKTAIMVAVTAQPIKAHSSRINKVCNGTPEISTTPF